MLNEHTVAKWISHISKKIKRRIIQAQIEVAHSVAARAQRELPKDLGKMEAGYRVRTTGDTTTLSNTQHYIKYIDRGRRAFVGSPVPLRQWAMRRLGVPANAAYGVARAIASKPYKGKEFFSGKGIYKIKEETKAKMKRLLI